MPEYILFKSKMRVVLVANPLGLEPTPLTNLISVAFGILGILFTTYGTRPASSSSIDVN